MQWMLQYTCAHRMLPVLLPDTLCIVAICRFDTCGGLCSGTWEEGEGGERGKGRRMEGREG